MVNGSLDVFFGFVTVHAIKTREKRTVQKMKINQNLRSRLLGLYASSTGLPRGSRFTGKGLKL